MGARFWRNRRVMPFQYSCKRALPGPRAWLFRNTPDLCEGFPKKIPLGAKKILRRGPECIFSPLPNFARACGRVSVGGDPDKRPVNRQQKPAAGGEPANPAKRGTRLKATTDRAFSSLLALQRLAYRRGLSFLPGVRSGSSSHSKRWPPKPWTAASAIRGGRVHGAAPDRPLVG